MNKKFTKYTLKKFIYFEFFILDNYNDTALRWAQIHRNYAKYLAIVLTIILNKLDFHRKILINFR